LTTTRAAASAPPDIPNLRHAQRFSEGCPTMDTSDRSDRTLPAHLSAALPALPPRASWDESMDAAAAPPPKTFTLKVVLRAAKRHWWQILGLWMLGSVVMVPLLYYKVKPTYDAIAWLRIEPTNRSLIATAYDPNSAGGTYLETQVQLITSPDVLGAALINPKYKLTEQPHYRTSLDAEAELRKNLRVTIIPKTTLIQIAVTSESAQESADVVNAVLDGYKEKSDKWSDIETTRESDRLKELKGEYGEGVEKLRGTLKGFHAKTDAKDVILEDEKDKISVAEYRSFNRLLEELQKERIKAHANLEHLEFEAKRSGGNVSVAVDGAGMDDMARAQFVKDPAAMRLADEVRKAKDTLDKVTRISKKERASREPTVIRAKKELDDLNEEWQKLWEEKEPEIKAAIASRGENTLETALSLARRRVKDAELAEKLHNDQMKKFRVSALADNDQSVTRLEMQFAQQDLELKQAMLQTVERNLQQLEYEARRATRTTQVVMAKPPGQPTSDNRVKLMASLPIVLLGFVMGLFVLVEVRSARVADPDDLPARVKLGVIGVVPPLPTMRPTRGLRGLKDERRRVEEFVQSLDHLRVMLCAGQNGTGGRRCVMITSATCGEGKTTLAAQLAGRCANAGLLTLLVDADLRRPSLGELLEVPEGPGLVDILADEASPEEAMVVIGSAGGFHLLPAGSPAGDPSRLLQGERLGTLIARFRETFDVVIVDAPPVLAVPDALILGRWVDGAVLAVRHDTSRFPLVERANRRLASINIPVLGAVVNGVRPMEATYGAYSYSTAATEDEPATT
jgi:capsular exopolysaccharide synthesis family protein